MMSLLLVFPSLREGGLRYNEKVITPGAQTEHRGDAGPVRVLLRGGHSPADFFLVVVAAVRRPY